MVFGAFFAFAVVLATVIRARAVWIYSFHFYFIPLSIVEITGYAGSAPAFRPC
jgi:hypothetical protein